MAKTKGIVMKRKPAKPAKSTWITIDFYDGQRLGEIIEQAKKAFGDSWEQAVFSKEEYDDYSHNVYVYTRFNGYAPATQEQLDKYERELAEYNEWYKANKDAITAQKKADAEAKRQKEIKQLVEQETRLAKQLEAIKKSKEKLGI